jgi:hypothetical protein
MHASLLERVDSLILSFRWCLETRTHCHELLAARSQPFAEICSSDAESQNYQGEMLFLCHRLKTQSRGITNALPGCRLFSHILPRLQALSSQVEKCTLIGLVMREAACCQILPENVKEQVVEVEPLYFLVPVELVHLCVLLYASSLETRRHHKIRMCAFSQQARFTHEKKPPSSKMTCHSPLAQAGCRSL